MVSTESGASAEKLHLPTHVKWYLSVNL